MAATRTAFSISLCNSVHSSEVSENDNKKLINENEQVENDNQNMQNESDSEKMIGMVHMKELLCFRSGVRSGKRHLQDVERG